MELQFEKDLPHQRTAIESILKITGTIHVENPFGATLQNLNANRKLEPKDEKIKDEIEKLQENFQPNMKNNFVSAEKPSGIAKKPCLYIDVKMETGTGKTYVYTETIHELHRQLGVSKFIVVVPGTAIKAGTSNFIKDPNTRRHFRDTCGYDSEIYLIEGTAQKGNNKRKRNFPSAVRQFYMDHPGNSKKYISVLLLNSALLTNSNYTKKDFDDSLDNYSCPLEALRATNPIVIIDEPHRFADENKAMNAIMNQLCPQILIRFGATYPDIKVGKGKNKTNIKDYKNLVYNLDAYESLNQGLIKGVISECLPPLSQEKLKVKVAKILKKNKEDYEVNFTWDNPSGRKVNRTFLCGTSLSEIDEGFQNLYIRMDEKKGVMLSNGMPLKEGDSLTPDMYATPYQESMLKMAIRRHLETEEQNFRREDKIKTLALFFIDDISAYRKENGQGILLKSFEKELKRQIKEKIEKLPKDDEYRNYLQKSLDNISDTHGGYFSEDNSSSSEEVQEQISQILRNKKELLSIENQRRFIFSKWTLKEGWDNPNVFTIAKLRSSGSENSKLQEVGRGLRLPVNEYGKRITDTDFYLNYIVDYTEKDFVEKLRNEIDHDHTKFGYITSEQIKVYAEKNGKKPNQVLVDLLQKEYISSEYGEFGYEVNQENAIAFANEYPDLFGVSTTRTKVKHRDEQEQINIRKENYAKLKKLWLKMNEHYVLSFDEDLNRQLEKKLPDLIKQEMFQEAFLQSQRKQLVIENNATVVKENTGNNYSVDSPLDYGKFLQRIQQKESVPVAIMHKAICEFVKKGNKVENKGLSLFNEQSLEKVCNAIHEWKFEAMKGRFSYQKISRNHYKATALNEPDGRARDYVTMGTIGKFDDPKCSVPEKYLYDRATWDSDLEKQDILGEIDGVEVFGKIPKSTVRIPTILGETYSPDFMYIVRRKGKNELNLIVECKDVKNDSELRGVEALKIESAKKFFEQLEKEGIKVHFEKQLKDKNLETVIKNL